MADIVIVVDAISVQVRVAQVAARTPDAIARRLLEDTFFDLGGHSLLAAVLIAQLSERFRHRSATQALLQ